MMKKPVETLLDEFVEKAGQAQVVRMFRNSALDGKSKLAKQENYMNTEIRIRYVTSCSAYSENGWWAELVEDGEIVWPEVRAFSVISPETAIDRMLMKLDGVIGS